MDYFECSRCGQETISRAAYEKAITRGTENPICRDCRNIRLLRVQYGDDYCIPHQALFDRDDYPVNYQGKRIYPGEPTCGHRDCVKPSHHQTETLVPFVTITHLTEKKFAL